MESQRTTQKGNCGHRTYRNILSLNTLVDIDHKRHGHQGSAKKDDGRKQVEIVSHIERHVHTHEQGQAGAKHEEPCVSHEFKPSEHTAEPPMAPEGYRGAARDVNSNARCKRPARANRVKPWSQRFRRLPERVFPAIIQPVFSNQALPSGVVVAQGNLDPLVQVQFLARQPSSSTQSTTFPP